MRKGFLSLASTVLAILLAAVAIVAAGTLAVGARPARAAYPGTNGKIVYPSDRDGDYDLYIRNADGTGKPQRLTNAPGEDTSPSWQPIH